MDKRGEPLIPESWPRNTAVAIEGLGRVKGRFSEAGNLFVSKKRIENDTENTMLIV